MTKRVLTLFKRAFNLSRRPNEMPLDQRLTYKALKRRYVKSSPAERATMRENARGLIATPSTT